MVSTLGLDLNLALELGLTTQHLGLRPPKEFPRYLFLQQMHSFGTLVRALRTIHIDTQLNCTHMEDYRMYMYIHRVIMLRYLSQLIMTHDT